jgi:plasmid maintenance system antidote protein VapI
MVKPRPLHKKNGLLLAEMTRRGFTIQSLAEATDVHYLTIWRIVNQEHNPGKDTAAKISDVLDVDLERLGLQVWGTGSSNKNRSE